MIGIVNFGLGNIMSVAKALDRINVKFRLVENTSDFDRVSHFILPGVGNFNTGIKLLKNAVFFEQLMSEIKVKQKPVLGICLGMQFLTNYSEEGFSEGLKLIPSKTSLIVPNSIETKVPHIGWNKLQANKKSILLNSINSEDEFYFVHSYAVEINSYTSSQTKYFETSFSSIIEKDNIYGVQFHPEKSHVQGLKILDNFIKYG